MTRFWKHWQTRLCYLLAREFQRPALCMLSVIFGGGYILHVANPKELGSFSDAMFAAFAASFFEISVHPPYPWYEQIFLYIAPILGIFFIADSAVLLFTLLSRKRQNLQQWWIMMALSYQDHVVVCGVGKVGYRIIRELHRMGHLVVGIELETHMLVEELVEQKIPVVLGNARMKSILERANVQQARAIICATEDDLTNLDCAFTAREIKPGINVVLRMFDDTIAGKISTQFNIPAISTSYACAAVFISKALDLETPKNLNISRHPIQVEDLAVDQNMDGKSVSQLEQELHVKVLSLKSEDGEHLLPCEGHVKAGNTVTVVRLLDSMRN